LSQEASQSRLAAQLEANASRPLFSATRAPPPEVLPHVYTSSSLVQTNVLSHLGTKYTLPMGTERVKHEVRRFLLVSKQFGDCCSIGLRGSNCTPRKTSTSPSDGTSSTCEFSGSVGEGLLSGKIKSYPPFSYNLIGYICRVTTASIEYKASFMTVHTSPMRTCLCVVCEF
jgi:hypothetical protein